MNMTKIRQWSHGRTASALGLALAMVALGAPKKW